MDLTDFLLARIAEDEEVARTASPAPWLYTTVESVGGGALYDKTRTIGSLHYEQPNEHDGRIVRHLLEHEADANGAHIARHDPARVLAECEAKRRIVAAHPVVQHGTDGRGPEDEWECRKCYEYPASWCTTLRALALPYADHPDYREEWRP